MTCCTDSGATTANEWDPSFVSSQTQPHRKNQNQPPHTNQEDQGNAGKPAGQDGLRRIQVSIFIENVNGNEEEALREYPMGRDRCDQNRDHISEWKREEIGGPLRPSWGGDTEGLTTMGKVVPFFGESHACVEAVKQDILGNC
jgi:hypothetical protein